MAPVIYMEVSPFFEMSPCKKLKRCITERSLAASACTEKGAPQEIAWMFRLLMVIVALSIERWTPRPFICCSRYGRASICVCFICTLQPVLNSHYKRNFSCHVYWILAVIFIDVPRNAVQTGTNAAACSAISQAVSDLPVSNIYLTVSEQTYAPCYHIYQHNLNLR